MDRKKNETDKNAYREKKNAMNQVKECDGLNETSHSFPNVFRVSFIYVKDTISHTTYEKKHSANSRYSDMYIFIHI